VSLCFYSSSASDRSHYDATLFPKGASIFGIAASATFHVITDGGGGGGKCQVVVGVAEINSIENGRRHGVGIIEVIDVVRSRKSTARRLCRLDRQDRFTPWVVVAV
jgi:hypothetical protein